jgi:hypothetical protein
MTLFPSRKIKPVANVWDRHFCFLFPVKKFPGMQEVYST